MLRTFLAALGLLVLHASAHAAPCAGFDDVDDSDPFCASVSWIKNREITLGCTPTLFCPGGIVSRLQMAAFLSRLGEHVADTTFRQGGNAFGTTGILGVSGDQALEIRLNGGRVMRYEPGSGSQFHNVVGGNGSVEDGVIGATIAGGGTTGATSGYDNRIGGDYGAIGGGFGNYAGERGTVPGGAFNSATGFGSFAAGYRAKATTQGTFMWADGVNVDFVPSVANFFGVRATGGIGFTVAVNGTGASTQFCNFLPGFSGWSCVSDRDAKENFVAVDGEAILASLVGMPLYSWNFKGADPGLRMLGPTSQDFRAAFALGSAEETIASGNLDGVALAAIKGLNAKVEAQAREIADLRAAIAQLMAK